MNDLDTEIRRAMGELADAAPPAREPESFRRDLEDGRGAAASGTSRWLLAAVATVVVGLVGVVLVVTASDDPPGTITQDPVVTEPTTALVGDALLAELSGRRWVALERFDDPSPTARTPEFTVTTSSAGASIAGFDGCNTYGGAFRLEGATVGAGEIASTTIGCDVETLSVGGSIELFPGSATLLLSDRDGTPVARFHDLARLAPASAADMPDTFFADELDSVGFGFLGDGRAGCTRIGWEESADGVRIELLEILDGCPSDDGPLGEWLAAIAEPGAEALVTPDGILLANASTTLQLRRLPVVEPDPDGVTLAAGAIFGIEPGLGTGPDDVLAEIAPRLGPPDADSGWLPAKRTVTPAGTVTVLTPCPDLTRYRELHWGDLSFAFWGAGSRSLLQYWNVGDGPAIGFDVPETDRSNAAAPTELRTEDGVGVGDPVTAIPDRFDTSGLEQIFGSDPTDDVGRVTVLSSNPAFTPGSVASPTRGGGYTVVDDVVVGFGAQTFGC
jgi:hypothetical protein